MLPHLKTWTSQQKEAARIAFDEDSRQRTAALLKQPRFTSEEILTRFLQTKVTVRYGQLNVKS